MVAVTEFVYTLDDEEDENIGIHAESMDEEELAMTTKAKKDAAMNSSFVFSTEDFDPDVLADPMLTKKGARAVWDFGSVKEMMSDKRKSLTSLDDKILKRKRQMTEKRESERGQEDSSSASENSNAESDDVSGSEMDVAFDSESECVSEEEVDLHSDSEDEDEDEVDLKSDSDDEGDDFEGEDATDGDEEDVSHSAADSENDSASSQNDSDSDLEDRVVDKRKADFFADEAEVKQQQEDTDLYQAFTDMNLSRPILKGLADVGFVSPTRIQAMTIPLALMGKDICGGAVTGSGKTAAFLVPILERLLYRPGAVAAIRVLILTPTRELAAQCYSVAVKLAKYTDISFCLCVGGISNQQQEAQLRQRPDVVIATPGRLIDHLQNAACFGLENIEILVMDEADRMLEDGFQAELQEIVKECPRGRQTLLFSATMTDNVDQLISLSLNRPVRLFIDAKNAVAHKLVQEFIRVRPSATPAANLPANGIIDPATFTQRESILLALCARTYRRRCILFLPSKLECHRMKILFGLNGLNAAELHGNLTQLQRIEALEQFRDEKVDFLLATDLAARGLDIAGVETVINFQMPPSYERYVHRVGRTARYERSGRAVTLVGEKERKMVKLAVKNLKPGQEVKQRVIPPEIIQKYRKRIEACEPQLQQVLVDEKEEKELQQAEMQLAKAENLMTHESEIKNRPAKTWFQSDKERDQAKKLFRQLAPQHADAWASEEEPASAASSGEDEHFEINKALAEAVKQPLQRGKDAGLSRKEKRRRMEMEEEKAADKPLTALMKSQKLSAKRFKKAAREDPEAYRFAQMKERQKRKVKKLKKPSMRFDRDLASTDKSTIKSGSKMGGGGGGRSSGGKSGNKNGGKNGNKKANKGGKKPHVKGAKGKKARR